MSGKKEAMMIKNRYMGRFRIPLKWINDIPSTILDIMNGMIVLEATTRLESASIEYLAISPKHFCGVAHGERAPEYELIFFSGDDINDFKFVELKDMREEATEKLSQMTLDEMKEKKLIK